MARLELTQFQYRRLIDIMDSLPRLLTVAGRENLLEIAGLTRFAGDIEFAAPRRDFSQQLVRRLQDYGTLNGKPALVYLLKVMRDMAEGREEDAAFLDAILSAEWAQIGPTKQKAYEAILQANPGSEPMVFIAIDEALLASARAVGQVSVPKIVDGQVKRIPTGTGWLITPNLALTCWHVIKARHSLYETITESDLQDQITNTLFTFDYLRPGEGIEYGISALEHFNGDLDYVVLRLKDRAGKPLDQRGFVKLDLDVPLALQTQLFIIQHPLGQPQQRSGGFFKKYAANNSNLILHSAPSEVGTSGAPVIHLANGRVVALHKGENEAEQLREATLLTPVLSDLAQQRPDIYDEIMKTQKTKE